MQYRVSWEMPSAMVADEIEHGQFFVGWPQVDWSTLEWHASQNITTNYSHALLQYNKLKEWAETKKQPIRNVKIEQRPEEDWSSIPEDQPCPDEFSEDD